MKKLVKATAAVVAITLLVAGTPVALTLWGRLNVLVSLDWSQLFTRPDDGSFLLGVLTLVGWAAWASVTCSLVGEVIAQLRHRPLTFRLPGTAWFAPAAAALIGTVAALGAVTVTLPGATPDAAVSHISASINPDSSAGFSVPGLGSKGASPDATPGLDAAVTSAAAPDAPDSATSQGATATSQAYLVKPGDDLWSLAEQHLGSGARWGEIVEANDSSLLDPLGELVPGSVLMLPTQSATPTVAAPAASTATTGLAAVTPPTTATQQQTRITVRPGDTLWDLAATHLGEATLWPELHEANQDTVPNPDLIYPGQQLRLPASANSDSGEAASQSDMPQEIPSGETAASSENQADGTEPEYGNETDTSPASDDPRQRVDADPPADADTTTPHDTDTANPADGDISTPASDDAPRSRREQSAHSYEADADNTADGSDPAESLSSAERVLAALGPMGAVVAAAVLMASQARRATQMHERALGRSVPTLDETIARFETALTRQAATLTPPEQLDGTAVTYVVLGLSDDDQCQQVELDLANAGIVCVLGDAQTGIGLVGAIAAQLLESCALSNSALYGVAGSHPWLSDLDDERILFFADNETMMAAANRDAIERLAHLERDETAVDKQQDPNLGDAWMPHFYLANCNAATPDPAIDYAAAGITVLIPGGTPNPSSSCSIEVAADRTGVVYPYNQRFIAHVLTPDVEERLTAFAVASASASSDPAPWWDDTVPDAPDDLLEGSASLSASPQHVNGSLVVDEDGLRAGDELLLPSEDAAAQPSTTPMLLVLGEIGLTGCAGSPPERAVQQCIEYTGWLLQNPNATSLEMADSLLIAEGTRRSNLSRLRGWLGDAPDGRAYLPEAYSGRMRLHPVVTSDWNQFESFVSGGVNKVSSASLIRALSLVRGVPLQDAPPGLWGWASNWRNRMVGTIRDAAVVLGSRALDSQQYSLARWALERGCLVVEHDDLLAMVALRLEHALGNKQEVDRIVLSTVRYARDMCYDLSSELLQVISYVTRPPRVPASVDGV
jgi:nucleoid-associated protein YgaU